MPRALTPDALLNLLEQAPSRLIVPSAAAASDLRRRHAARQQQAGRSAWTPPDVLSWSQWTSALWTELILSGADDRLLLNSAQEEALWREIIADNPAPSLAPATSLAELARSAYALAASFRAIPMVSRTASNTDTRTFAAWAEAFRARCARDRFLPAAELEYALERHLHDGAWRPPAHLHFCGAPSLAPTQQSLLAALEDAGCALDTLQLAASGSGVRHSTVLHDEKTELRFALRYVRRFLEQHPEARAALIVPDLPAELPQLEPALLELLAPELTAITADLSSTPWHISSGPPLAHVPAVVCALDLIRWARAPLPLDRVSSLLLAPHVCPDAERDQRARFTAGTLARLPLLRPELDLRATLRLARGHAPEFARWLAPVADAASHLQGTPPRRSFAEWTEAFRELLRAAGWPGERERSPAEFAATEAFDAVLDLVATLDFLGKRVTLAEATEAVAAQALRNPAPNATDAAPLQILSPGEAAGRSFDLLLVLRATDANLPPAAHAHPLLDRQMQRDLRMPGAVAAADDERARAEFAALLAACSSVLFTSAAHNREGDLRPSTLPRSFGVDGVAPETLLADEPAPEPVPLLAEPDTAPLPPLPSMEVPGGARLLKLQAACGFLAFAELRLGGRELQTQEPGFDAAESGNVLHRTLEAFWNDVQSQQNLRHLSPADREAKLNAAVEHAIAQDSLRPASPWDTAYIAVQTERMVRLLTRWLDFELARGPFTVISNEAAVPTQIGPLHLQLRIDRVDTLPDGGYVLVDYKTGLGAKHAAWEGDRPDEPQLPLYALLGEAEELRGLAFARVRAGKDMGWDGLQTDAGILPQKRPAQTDLTVLRDEWQAVLTQLAWDFHDGHAHVHPKSYAVNCKRCAQRLLCRLDVLSLMEEPDSEEESGHE